MLTEDLADLQSAEQARVDFLNNNADNELLEDTAAITGVAEGDEPTPAEVATAIEQADTGADDAVVAAENDLLDDQAALANARANEFDTYGTDTTDDSTVNGTVTGPGTVGTLNVNTAVSALDSLTADSRISDANLNAAETEAQADVDADETTYTSTGAEVALADGQTELVVLYQVAAGDVITNTSLTADNYISENFAGTKQVSTVGFTSVPTSGAADVYTITINGVDFSATYSDTTTALTKGDFTNSTGDDIETATGFSVSINGSDVEITGLSGESFTLAATEQLNDAGSASDVTPSTSAEAMTAEQIIADENTTLAGYTDVNEGLGLAGGTDLTAEIVSGDVTEASLASEATVYTAAELQTAITDAEQSVASFVSVNGDNTALLDALRDAINAHIGAGGDNETFISGNADLLALRNAIAGVVDADSVDETEVNNLVDAIATEVSKAAYEDGVLTVAEGETLTSEQKAVNAAFSDVEERVELDGDVVAAEEAFATSTTGKVLTIIDIMQEERQDLIDAITTAEGELTDAQALAAQTQDLVDQLEQLDTNIEDAEKVLTDAGYTVKELGETTSEEQDIFLFTETDAALSIGNFELTETDAEGNVTAGDRIFLGEELSVVAAGEGEDITDSLGAVEARDVIVVDDGTDTTLYIEDADAAFAGNGSGTADMTEITLTGVTGAEVSVNADGFLTVA